MNYKQVIKKYTPLLRDVTHIPQKEVELLLLSILNQNIIWLHININQECQENIIQKLEILVKKRATFYPLEYLTKRVSFYGETFLIEDGVLIPRSETEILVEKAEKILQNISQPKVVEVGVGSGIISIMLALLVKDIQIISIDINDKALQLAKQNAKKFNVENKIQFIKSDIFAKVDIRNFDMCISNPPYIAEDYTLPTNVQYEPSSALFGGKVGDELLKNIIIDTKKNDIKYLLCEMGYDQQQPLGEFLKDFETNQIEFYKDLEDFDRGFVVEFKI